MTKLLSIMREIGFPFAYHHFAEGESPSPPFLLFLTPASSNFAADGKTSVSYTHLTLPTTPYV